MALDPEVRRVVLLDGPAFLGDPSRWPSQNACLHITKQAVAKLVSEGVMTPIDIEAAARRLSGAAFECGAVGGGQRRAAIHFTQSNRGLPADGDRLFGRATLEHLTSGEITG